jgi:hypothetical protein
MSGQRSLDTDLCRLGVPHFANHDHIWVGTQEGAHGRGEGPADLGMHLDLPQPRLADFDGILDGPDLEIRQIDFTKHRVQGGGFP